MKEREAKMTNNGQIWSNIRICCIFAGNGCNHSQWHKFCQKRKSFSVMTRLPKGLQDLIQDKHYILLAQYGRPLTRALKLQWVSGTGRITKERGKIEFITGIPSPTDIDVWMTVLHISIWSMQKSMQEILLDMWLKRKSLEGGITHILTMVLKIRRVLWMISGGTRSK